MARHLPEGWVLEYKTIDKSGVKAYGYIRHFFLASRKGNESRKN